MSRVFAALAFVGVFCVSTIASAQPHRSLCADCHSANGGGPEPRHLSEWESSAHARANVGCEACHGGKPDTVEPFLAHQAIVRGRGADSPLSAANLPRTCGRCHPDVYVEFKKSRHAALFAEGIHEGPTCSTCHSTVAGYLLSPKSLESQCNTCHGANKKTARPEYAANARTLLQNVRDVRELLNTTKPIIKRVKDTALHASLQNRLRPGQRAGHGSGGRRARLRLHEQRGAPRCRTRAGGGRVTEAGRRETLEHFP